MLRQKNKSGRILCIENDYFLYRHVQKDLLGIWSGGDRGDNNMSAIFFCFSEEPFTLMRLSFRGREAGCLSCIYSLFAN